MSQSQKRSAHAKKNVTSITAVRVGDQGQVAAESVLKAIQRDLDELHRQIDRLEEMVTELSECASSKSAGC